MHAISQLLGIIVKIIAGLEVWIYTFVFLIGAIFFRSYFSVLMVLGFIILAIWLSF